MREEKPKSASQKKKQVQRKSWFWPLIYSGIAIVFVGMIWGTSALISKDSPSVTDSAMGDKPESGDLIVETNAPNEILKFPFSEDLLEEVVILQDYYDMKADAATREKSVLVFNQSYVTNTGISLSAEDKPFEVVAAMSGVVEEVVEDVFQGDEIVISHADGLKTVYGSVTGILVNKGDKISQGDPIATASSNEWNPSAGTHLHFEVLLDNEPVNPGSYLAFK